MKYLYRVFAVLAILGLALLVFFGYSLKRSGANKGISKITGSNVLKRKDEDNVKVFDGNNPLHVLVLGVDKSDTLDATAEQNGARTDTIMVVTIDPEYDKVQILSIPRDSYIRVHGYDKNKVNSAFNPKVYPGGGINLTAKTIEDFLDIKIDHYAIIDYQAVVGIVDAVGGMDIYWDGPDYHYEDNWVVPPLVIDLKHGENHLNGKNAVGYLRTRKIYKNQDIGRISAQQDFLMNLFEKMKSPKMILKVPTLIDIVGRYVETDLNLGEISKLAYYGLGLEPGDISSATVDGYPKMMKQGKYDLSFWIVDSKEARKLVHEFPQNVMEEVEEMEQLPEGTDETVQ